MKVWVVALGLFWSLRQEVPPSGFVADAIRKVRSQNSYKGTFKAEIRLPNSDPFRLSGTSVWSAPGILFIELSGSGGQEKQIVRVGDESWTYHTVIEDWVTTDEVGDSGAAKGVQNPDEVLGVLLKYADKGERVADPKTPAGVTLYRLKASGQDVRKVMEEQSLDLDRFQWDKSTVEVRFFIRDSDQLITGVETNAELILDDPDFKGEKATYHAEVEVVSYNVEKELIFRTHEDKGVFREIPLSPKIRKKIETLRGQK